ncbi:MAG TPA: winged helix-turn-helix domain-containing protein, partial [Burkholderiaceae bacterium]|nr:winged helix-turn-helix domain-containing protein [Burkholderiaceae bacterium]
MLDASSSTKHNDLKQATFHFADWLVSPPTNTISRVEIRRQMEPRAMDVLVALCSRAGTVISAEELLQLCWGTTLFGDNPVHKVIAQLRSVLGDDTKAPIYIETIRKRGYRTVADVRLATDSQLVSATESWYGKSPFRGLQPFVEEYAQVFFGRSDATAKLLHAVAGNAERAHAITLVLGPSGSGKTSLIRAGLLPKLMRVQDNEESLHVASATTFDLADMGEHQLFAALGSALIDWQIGDGDVNIFPGASGASLGQRLVQDIESVVIELQNVLIDMHKQGTHRRVALFVDRFEAIFASPHISASERDTFINVLDRLARSNAVVVIVACRNDFYPHIAQHELLMEGKAHGGHFDLSPPTTAEIAQIIRSPAHAAQLTFGIDAKSHARLDDVLCESASGSPDALPLLQYTLQELYRLRSENDELSFEAFHHLGGVEGALGRRADEVVEALSEDQRKSLP